MTKTEMVLLAVSQGKFPRILYKYRAPSGFTDRIFTDQEFFFPAPDKLNDPFECQIPDAGGYSNQEICDFLAKWRLPPQFASAVLGEHAANPTFITESLDAVKKAVFNKKGILCLSKSASIIQMWSHYAASHSGICIGMDICSDPDFFVTPLEVKYQEAFPGIQYLKESDKIVSHCIATKHIKWDYEEEVRILKHTQGAHKFDCRALREVIFGCKTTEDEKNRIITLVRDNKFPDVVFKQASITHDQFKINITKIDA